MKKVEINIHGIYDITRFVKYASDVKSDINVYKDNQVIDGSSLMSMMTIDSSKNLIVEYPEDAKDFEDFLAPFIV